MRPPILNIFFIPVPAIKGIGAKLAPLIERLCGKLSKDVIFTIPRKLNDRRRKENLSKVIIGESNCVQCKITQHIAPSNPRHPFKVLMTDGRRVLHVALFNVKQEWVLRQYPIGVEVIICGKIDIYASDLTMTNPELVILATESFKYPDFEPVYWLTSGLSPRILYRTIQILIDQLPILPEWLSESTIKHEKFIGFTESLWACHRPQSMNDANPSSPHRRRLAYDELLAHNYLLRRMRAQHSVRKLGKSLVFNGEIWQKILAHLPWGLTEDQVLVINEIAQDLKSPHRMTRLLQGDVGSGKTIVALYAMICAVESGGQAVLMAPTEILANQHFMTIQKFCAPINCEITLLTGKDKGKIRKEKSQAIQDGKTQIIIGTHAVFSDDINYQNLLFIAIDEQHRFGVKQRSELYAKGEKPDFLIMSATPIPRSLTMAIYGDLSVSRLEQKPKNRQPIKTSVLSVEKFPQLAQSLLAQLNDNQKAFWVCPLIEESETLTQASIEKRYNELIRIIPMQMVGVIHGRHTPQEKTEIMNQFTSGQIKLLIATTVIEVGVDVPSANIMIIEGAERFGLSQLHQLRGRVGRGEESAQCILIYTPPISQKIQQRLQIMRTQDNGFIIAEEDLKMRGSGDILGTKQSGLPDFHFVDFDEHSDIMIKARLEAELILHNDPDLTSPRGENLKILLHLFS